MLRGLLAALPRPDGSTSGGKDAGDGGSADGKSAQAVAGAGGIGENVDTESMTKTSSSSGSINDNRWKTVYLDDDFRIDQDTAGHFLLFIRESV